LPKYKDLTKKNINFAKKKRFVERWSLTKIEIELLERYYEGQV
jgi:hypothetical protein